MLYGGVFQQSAWVCGRCVGQSHGFVLWSGNVPLSVPGFVHNDNQVCANVSQHGFVLWSGVTATGQSAWVCAHGHGVTSGHTPGFVLWSGVTDQWSVTCMGLCYGPTNTVTVV